MIIASVTDLIKLHEGKRLAAYDDKDGEPVPAGGQAKGTLTIGFGHTGSDVFPGQVCTAAQAEAWLAADIAIATARAEADLTPVAWLALDPVRQAALIDMAFEIGGRGLAEFHDMIAAIHAADWTEAHYQALDSDWARIEAPKRAAMDAAMLLKGEWPVLA